MKLKEDIKERWLAALRSGDYTQGRRTLRQVHGDVGNQTYTYCCLGVLCDLSIVDSVGRWEGDQFVTFDGLNYQYESGVLPEVVSLWAFGPHEPVLTDPRVSPYGKGDSATTLSYMNDRADGFGFDEIADAIARDL